MYFLKNYKSRWHHIGYCKMSCVVVLQVIFTQFQYSDQSALPPDSLRKALAKSFYDQRRFQQGHMDDAAECFVSILKALNLLKL